KTPTISAVRAGLWLSNPEPSAGVQRPAMRFRPVMVSGMGGDSFRAGWRTRGEAWATESGAVSLYRRGGRRAWAAPGVVAQRERETQMKPMIALVAFVLLGEVTARGWLAPAPAQPGAVNLRGAGTSFIKPVMDKWRVEYTRKKGGEITYQAVGSGNGIK